MTINDLKRELERVEEEIPSPHLKFHCYGDRLVAIAKVKGKEVDIFDVQLESVSKETLSFGV